MKRRRWDLTQSHDKSPYTNRKIQKATWHYNTPQKTSITQRLRTDLGRSAGVITVTALVWLKNKLTTQKRPQMSITQRKRNQWSTLGCRMCKIWKITTNLGSYWSQQVEHTQNPNVTGLGVWSSEHLQSPC